ncbi:MAG: homoprotocatechuate degradation operon regulator HpaR [Steroidobacteraceae bacterium]|jgi:homoprotocatechuate degradation regulator HpaR
MRNFDQSLPMMLLRAREAAMAFFRPLLNTHGVTEQQWRVIRILHEHADLEFHQLADISGVLPPSLTGILTRLERMGLVRRRKTAADQRRLHLSLTGEGATLFGRVSVEAERIYRDIEARFDAKRLSNLFALLRELCELKPEQLSKPSTSRARRAPRNATAKSR